MARRGRRGGLAEIMNTGSIRIEPYAMCVAGEAKPARTDFRIRSPSAQSRDTKSDTVSLEAPARRLHFRRAVPHERWQLASPFVSSQANGVRRTS